MVSIQRLHNRNSSVDEAFIGISYIAFGLSDGELMSMSFYDAIG
jgi:hypothetical protein